MRGNLQNLNFKFDKFKRSFRWQDDFKWKIINYRVSWLFKIYNFCFGSFFSYEVIWKTQKYFQIIFIGKPPLEILFLLAVP
jgi:hypothetical protein